MRKFSNTQVKNAGKVLCNSSKYKKSEVEEAQEILTYWRTLHASTFNTFQSTLREKLKRLNVKDFLVAQRLKRGESIVKKLSRFSNMKLSTMQDIAGLRAILKNIKEVRSLESNYKTSKFTHKLKDYKDYISNPAPTGYRGIHLIYEYINEKNPDASGLKIELQIRTKLQHTWATAVETMGTFLNHSLKSSQGPEEWLDYFSLVSAGFTILEKCPIPPKYAFKSNKEIFQEIIDKTIELDVDKKLSGYTVAAEHIVKTQTNSKYNLIILNLDKRILNIKNYTKKQLQQANIDYTNIEKEIINGANLQAVLVSTGSIESLRRAYPSYFLDSKEYLKKIELIKNRINKI